VGWGGGCIGGGGEGCVLLGLFEGVLVGGMGGGGRCGSGAIPFWLLGASSCRGGASPCPRGHLKKKLLKVSDSAQDVQLCSCKRKGHSGRKSPTKKTINTTPREPSKRLSQTGSDEFLKTVRGKDITKSERKCSKWEGGVGVVRQS